MIPYGRQDITESDIDAVISVLRSDYLTQGPVVPLFEDKLKSYTGADHAVAVNSATSALHIACLALGLEQGDILWTSPITFVASANCGVYCGAKIDFVDIDPDTFNICPLLLRQKLEKSAQEGALPKIVIVVHMCGKSCDMKSISLLSKEFGFAVIEDASHAIGGRYCDEPIGCCRYSDVTVFSFHPVKIITTCEGGAALTNNKNLAEKMVLYRSHGITRDPSKMTNFHDAPWYYEQVTLGFNYRMTELQAALGVSQLDRIDSYVESRHKVANKYKISFADLPLTTQRQTLDDFSAFHLFVIQCEGGNRDKLFQKLRGNNVGVNLHYIPVHTQPFYKNMGFSYGDYPNAEKYYTQAITLPLYPKLSNDDQDFIIEIVRRTLNCSNANT
jgi:UDP-4-amino-4,6-dideoxy-N-acetyl-beta-L-altrosamine transaminase